jgi:hypothetical protein
MKYYFNQKAFHAFDESPIYEGFDYVALPTLANGKWQDDKIDTASKLTF